MALKKWQLKPPYFKCKIW